MKLTFRQLKNSDRTRILLRRVVIFLVALYSFFLPSFGESTGWKHYLIFLVLVVIFLVVLLYFYLFGGIKFNSIPPLILLFILIALIGTIAYSKEFRKWLSLLLLLGSFILLYHSFQIINNRFVSISAILIGLSFFCLYFIWVYRNDIIHFSELASGNLRLGSYFDNENGVAAYSVICFASSFYMLLFSKKKIRFLYIVPMLLSLLVGFSTGSRTFFLITGIFVAVFLFFVFKKHKLIYVLAVVGIFSVTLLLVFFAPPFATIKFRLIQAFETLFGTAQRVDVSTLSRTVYFDYGFFLGTKNILIGYGMNGFNIYSGIGTYSHSNFSEVLCNFGIFGFIIFYFIIFYLLYRCCKKKVGGLPFVVPFTIYYLLVSFSNVFYYNKTFYLILALISFLVFHDTEMSTNKRINNVLFMCDSMTPGGAERVISILANNFSELGMKINILGVSDRSNLGSFYKLKNNVCYYQLASSEGFKKTHIGRLIYLVKFVIKKKPDLIISFLPHVQVYTLFVSSIFDIKYVVSERNDPNFEPKQKIIRFLKDLSFEASSGCIFQTKYAMNYYSYFVRAKSAIINNPVIIPEIKKDNFVYTNCVISAGRLTQQKDFECLIKGFSLFNKNHDQKYKLIIFGDGEKKSDLEELAASESNGKIIFVGSDPNWLQKVGHDCIYVCSSIYEGMPNSLIEAFLLGIPCVASDSPAFFQREIIKDGVNGFLFKPGDYQMLSNKIECACACDTAYLKKNNVLKASSFNEKEITNEWINYINSII